MFFLKSPLGLPTFYIVDNSNSRKTSEKTLPVLAFEPLLDLYVHSAEFLLCSASRFAASTCCDV